MKSSTLLLAILVLQALLVSAAVAKGYAAGPKPKKQCCTNCVSWSGVYTCDEVLTKCAATCKNCVPVWSEKGPLYMCRDPQPEGCPCKAN